MNEDKRPSYEVSMRVDEISSTQIRQHFADFHKKDISRARERGRSEETIRDFTYEYLAGLGWAGTAWQGVPLLKCPLDLWIYQELLFQLRPDVIVECGTFLGGSALYLANLCDIQDKGRIHTIDFMEIPGRRVHPRIVYHLGSSTDPEVSRKIESSIGEESVVMVILDSAHGADHVLEEMRVWAPMVSVGSYLVVEDTFLGRTEFWEDHGPGPGAAVERFLETHHEDFAVDRELDKHLLSFNQGGWLKRLLPPRSTS